MPASMPDETRTVAVIGAGPAGLMAAERLAEAGCRVSVFDRMPSAGRKLLLAGRGGLNLTHSEPLERFRTRYGEATGRMAPWLERFPPQRLREWAASLGEPTTVGSSGRVFPQSWKSSPLLRAWLRRLDGLGVAVRTRHLWTGLGPDGSLLFDGPDGPVRVRAPDATILALGGASWPRLGSDGRWTATLAGFGIETAPLRPANAGLRIPWSARLVERFAGTPLKRIALAVEGERRAGEAVVTRHGLEGGAAYWVSGRLRDALGRGEAPVLTVDLRPDLGEDALAAALARPRGKRSLSTALHREARLAPVAVAVLREGTGGPLLPAGPAALARLIKALPLQVLGVEGLERAISSAGGIRFGDVDGRLMLTARPGVFAAGEMLDWEAPTGGYLLQGCFATGAAAAAGALAWMAEQGRG